MKLNITIYKNNNWYSIYSNNTLLHNGEINGKDVLDIIKSYGYEIGYLSLEPSYNYNTTRYYVEVK